MVRKSFKEVMKDDVNNTFMNVDEFADMHTVVPFEAAQSEFTEKKSRFS